MNETEQRREIECMKMRIDDLRQQLRYQDARDGTISTHWPGCWSGGRSHYECALAEIDRLTKVANHA